MTRYRVSWSIDLDADNGTDAARVALQCLRDYSNVELAVTPVGGLTTYRTASDVIVSDDAGSEYGEPISPAF